MSTFATMINERQSSEPDSTKYNAKLNRTNNAKIKEIEPWASSRYGQARRSSEVKSHPRRDRCSPTQRSTWNRSTPRSLGSSWSCSPPPRSDPYGWNPNRTCSTKIEKPEFQRERSGLVFSAGEIGMEIRNRVRNYDRHCVKDRARRGGGEEKQSRSSDLFARTWKWHHCSLSKAFSLLFLSLSVFEIWRAHFLLL